MSAIENEIITDLTVELSDEPTFSSTKLATKVKNVIREVKNIRRYEDAGYTDAQIEKDLYRFYGNIINISRYDYNAIGTEGQYTHVENGITTTFVSREKLFSGIVPLSSLL